MTMQGIGTQHQLFRGVIGRISLEENLKNLEEERDFLRLLFPGHSKSDFDREYFDRIGQGEITLPSEALSWMIMPDWRKINSEYYTEAIRMAFIAMQPFGNFFYNQQDGKALNFFRLRQSQRTIRAFNLIAAAQKRCGFYIVPIKFNPPSRVESYSSITRKEFSPNEFGPGVLMSAIFMAMNRVDYGSGLYLDGLGDEYWPDISCSFPGYKPPFLLFQKKEIFFFPERQNAPDLGGNYSNIIAYL
jgi:hypothetical protein